MSEDWLFDLGNTRLKFAPLRDDIADIHALPHDASAWQAGLPRGDTAYLACVAAAELRVGLLDALTQRFRRIAIARTARSFAGLRIAYTDPSKLGVDRFLAMLGARGIAEDAVLVVGVGTALTIDVVDASGQHRGGRIAPSPTLMRESLHRRAAQLPEAGGTYVEFADDTEAALASGCEGAALALIEHSLVHATRLLRQAPALLLHGGGSDDLRAHLAGARHEPALVLRGLAAWANALREAPPATAA
ncbi:MAG TPA: type III pantothenate kinase [Lysobacter sp.]|jgi:type III pantothenate kinase|nr:type III pantothenate kinase [Lysobacter sp.]